MVWWEDHILDITGVAGVIITAGFLAWQTWLSKTTKSAEFTMQFIKQIYEKRKTTLEKLANNKIDRTSESEIEDFWSLLGDLEILVQFLKKGVINESMVKHNFKELFETIAKNDTVKELVNEVRSHNLNTFPYIIWYLNKNKICHNFT